MIALGVTGHRRLAEVGKVAAGVDRAFEHVVAAFGSMPAAVVSCLAEGADRLVVQRALALGVSTLVAVLPLPADDYVDDFVSPDSKHEFRSLLARADRVIMSGPTGTRTEAYAAAGYALVNASRILLAVWDGEQARGRGGTGTVVEAARTRGLPLAWVHAGSPDPVTHEPRSLGERQGTVTVERLPPR